MNETHLAYLASDEWAQRLRLELLPWVQRAGDLGDDVIEVGPGPGLTTELLRERVSAVTAVEVDADLAEQLRDRLQGANVTVLTGDATATGLDADRFSAATCFSMLHHMEGPAAQDRLLAELHRVLRPGGLLVGVDARDLDSLRQAHVDDTFVPVSPDTLPARLQAAGFSNVDVDTDEYQVRFVARKPSATTA